MRKKSCWSLLFVAIISVLFILPSCNTEGWPQYRGAKSNLIVTGDNLPVEWGDKNNIKWTYGMEGESWSSPIIWGNKVFITSAYTDELESEPAPTSPPAQQGGAPGAGQAPPPGNAPGGAPQANVGGPAPSASQEEDDSYKDIVYRLELTCIDLGTGEKLWKQVASERNPRTKIHARGTYANETPVTDGKRVYVYFGMAGVYCYDLDGNLLWENDLGAFETANGWGTGSSPVIYNDILYVQVDNEVSSFIVALNAKTGEQKWKMDRDEKTNYSTPIVWENSIRNELVTTGRTARSYDLLTGEILWELEMDGGYSIPSPVATEDVLYLGNANEKEVGTLFAVKAGTEGKVTNDELAWSVPQSGFGNPSPLLYGGLLYVVNSRGGDVVCYDAATGEKVYEDEVSGVGACWASPWVYNDVVYFSDDKGVTHTFKAGRQFEELSKNSLDDTIWGSVASVNNQYVLKGVENVYCISN